MLMFSAFVIVTIVSHRAVSLAQEDKNAARNEAALARIATADAQKKLDSLERQFACVVNSTLKSLRGMLDNSIFQDDLLLSSVEGGDRTAVLSHLKETRARLHEIEAEIARIEQEPTCA